MSFSLVWRVLDDTKSPIGSLRSAGGSIAWDGNASIQRVARNVQFNKTEWQDVDPFRDRLQPVLAAPNGEAFTLGVFHVAQIPEVYEDFGETRLPEPYLVDGGFFLDQPSPFGFAGKLNENVSSLMARVCDAAGVDSRVISPAGPVFGEPVVWPPGTNFSQCLSDLCQLAGFLPPHFDRDGVLRLRPPLSLTAEPAVEYTSAQILRNTRVQNQNLLEAPNVFVVIGSGASESEIVAEAEVPSSAPHSVVNRGGRRIVAVFQLQGIDSFAQAKTIARQLALTQTEDYATIEFRTSENPAHDCYDVLSVNGERYRHVAWDLSLRAGGGMQHRANRADPTEAL